MNYLFILYLNFSAFKNTNNLSLTDPLPAKVGRFDLTFTLIWRKLPTKLEHKAFVGSPLCYALLPLSIYIKIVWSPIVSDMHTKSLFQTFPVSSDNPIQPGSHCCILIPIPASHSSNHGFLHTVFCTFYNSNHFRKDSLNFIHIMSPQIDFI